jgi:hypothetical protein
MTTLVPGLTGELLDSVTSVVIGRFQQYT